MREKNATENWSHTLYKRKNKSDLLFPSSTQHSLPTSTVGAPAIKLRWKFFLFPILPFLFPRFCIPPLFFLSFSLLIPLLRPAESFSRNRKFPTRRRRRGRKIARRSRGNFSFPVLYLTYRWTSFLEKLLPPFSSFPCIQNYSPLSLLSIFARAAVMCNLNFSYHVFILFQSLWPETPSMTIPSKRDASYLIKDTMQRRRRKLHEAGGIFISCFILNLRLDPIFGKTFAPLFFVFLQSHSLLSLFIYFCTSYKYVQHECFLPCLTQFQWL